MRGRACIWAPMGCDDFSRCARAIVETIAVKERPIVEGDGDNEQ